ncbi:hypothetical protein [Streptomyces sp. NPDC001675]
MTQLEEEVAQLRQAVVSHAIVAQFACTSSGQRPACGLQLANIKLHTITQAIIDWAQTRQPLPIPLEKPSTMPSRRT